MKNNFSDYLTNSSINNQSVLCAGLDPDCNFIPKVFIDEAAKKSSTDDEFYEKVLYSFYFFCLANIKKEISCIKPNIAFFEQYGIGGLKALQKVLQLAKELHVPSILDCKRGDIGSTAESYVKAYLTGVKSVFNEQKFTAFDAEAITVNPFLGFDTAETFLKGAVDSGKGLFYLVKTSNPGSKDIQDLISDKSTISEKIAGWIHNNSGALLGDSGLSGLGAVVGATHPEHLKKLRQAMPNSIFLIPGYGAQGGKASDLKEAFTKPFSGAVINASRGLFNAFKDLSAPKEDLLKELKITLENLNKPLNDNFTK